MNASRHLKRVFVVLFCILSPVFIHAQYNVVGKLSSKNDQVILFASVRMLSTSDSLENYGTSSDENGRFEFPAIPSGTFRLAIRMLGYQNWDTVITVQENKNVGVIALKEQVVSIAQVEITAKQSVLKSYPGKKVLNIGLDLTQTGSNVMEALEKIPSIITTPEGTVQIRGSENIVVYVNGKETKRDPASLQFISAEMLEKIEVITNPSAKYDAEGVGGIINLIYRKDKSSALKAEIISNLSILSNPLQLNPEGGLSASLSKRRFSFFTNLSIDYSNDQERLDLTRTSLNNELQFYRNNTLSIGEGLISNLNFGISFEPDTNLSMVLELNYDRWDLLSELHQENFFDYQNAPTILVDQLNVRKELENELWINYSLEKELGAEKKISASFILGGEDENNRTTNDHPIFNSSLVDRQLFIESTNEAEKQRYYLGQIDFTTPLFNFGEVEIGAKTDFIQYTIFQNVTLQSDSLQLPTNDFVMELQKIGLYALHTQKFNQMEYALGIRFEQFKSQGTQYSDGSNFKQHYLGLFPSFQMNYQLSKNIDHSLGFSYTRRINRPSFFDLNPFISFEDPLNLETGNPNLRPEIANLYEINYHIEWNKLSIDFSFFRRKVNDVIQAILVPLQDNTTITSVVNIGEELSQGMEGQVEYTWSKVFHLVGSFGTRQVQFNDQANFIRFNQQFSWRGRLTQELNLNSQLKMELTEIYHSPSFQIQESQQKVFYVNFGLRKKIAQNRANVSISIRDIFNTRQYAYTLLNEELQLKRRYKWQTRQINIGLKYLIFDRKK